MIEAEKTNYIDILHRPTDGNHVCRQPAHKKRHIYKLDDSSLVKNGEYMISVMYFLCITKRTKQSD